MELKLLQNNLFSGYLFANKMVSKPVSPIYDSNIKMPKMKTKKIKINGEEKTDMDDLKRNILFYWSSCRGQ